MKVYKFGGASVRTADGVRNLAHIVEGEENLFIIVSAMGKTTNALERVFAAMQKAQKSTASGRQSLLRWQEKPRQSTKLTILS